MNSVEITKYLYEKNYISKEAALRILKNRRDLVKVATEELTNELLFGIEKSAFPWTRQPQAMQVAPVPAKGILGPAARKILPLLGVAGLIALGTTASKVGLGLASDLKMSNQVKKSYKQMFKEYPELKEDKGEVTKFFNIMARYAPVLASNPVTAGTWVKGMKNQNMIPPESISKLLEVQRAWEDVRSMKSPMMGLAREMPDARSLFGQALAAD